MNPQMENNTIQEDGGRVWGYFDGKHYIATAKNAEVLRAHLLEGKEAQLNEKPQDDGSSIIWVNPVKSGQPSGGYKKQGGGYQKRQAPAPAPASNSEVLTKLDKILTILSNEFGVST